MKLKSKCPHCETLFPVNPAQIGLIVNCPKCNGRIKISKPATSGPDKMGMRYNFECPVCESQLEATENLAGKKGRCPSCAAEIIIPAINHMAELAAPTGPEGSVCDAAEELHAIHAFAASGLSAPGINKLRDGRKIISCPKCNFNNDVGALACGHCAMPFSIEGSTESTHSGHTAKMSMIFGLISMPLFLIAVFQILAIIMGIRALRSNRPSDHRRRYPAYIGIILGSIAMFFAIIQYMSIMAD